MVVSAANHLSNQEQLVNEMNVFPVPDGDTGTNMAKTMRAAADEVIRNPEQNVSLLAKQVSTAALRGARGNSGVILSQLLRGFAKGLGNAETADAKTLAAAVSEAVAVAYRAVMNPTEGTILTVARLTAEAAKEHQEETDLVSFFRNVLNASKDALNQTPKMLPVLAQAGVVDAGGMGLVTLLEGACQVVQGEGIVEAKDTLPVAETMVATSTDIHATSPFTYCTEFILLKHNPSAKLASLERAIKKMGDCALVINDETFAKVHVHTDHPGLVLQEALQEGALTDIKIDNMKEQQTQTASVAAEPKQEVGFVGVCSGDGIRQILHDLGIHQLISGGQTMNPSADDILQAIQAANAKQVFVFPNNKNIILAANQAAEIVEDCSVFVIPSKNIPQCITSMLAFQPDASPEENFQAMCDALNNVKAASVTYAVRDTVINQLDVNKGDIIGIAASGIICATQTVEQAVTETIEQLLEEEDCTISLYYGAEVHEEEATALTAKLEEHFADCDVLCYNGGQPVYYYLISIES